ncbi:Clavaminate synthase-like protein [Cucurbitaria berberidis CBS 394.84]|uniref:Clavaminate synthase-like protein n=1 Tax=Cucurbitaria berberidis CBS 394.84 TaxID=1168544 RepID=A0A9P4GLS7_9PLEO|nr:Clavaminate synthase-like protein [Cucurbitaria berberidis CBS 394.84]KAF1847421.1 Clavaminate synthase-like protein [Cucurbitaria berberidis CBS 394.84]
MSVEEARSEQTTYLKLRCESIPTNSEEAFNIPTIDISRSFSGHLPDRQAVAEEIHSASASFGFFYLASHGVSPTSCSKVLEQAEKFFKTLPLDKKELLHLRQSKFGSGWEPPQYTSFYGDVETKEAFNFTFEEDFDKTGGDGKWVNLDGSPDNGNMWPAEEDLPGFRGIIKDYYSELLELSRHLFRLFALSLSLPEDQFDSVTTHPGTMARMVYYPAAKNPKPLHASKDEEIGVGAHTDFECFTILLSSSCPGLEILNPHGRWVSVPPLAGTFVVNIGDFMMRWTNGLYKSTIHRVVNRSQEERYSVPFFTSINYDAIVETLPCCVSAENPTKYPPVRAGIYILERQNVTTKDGKGYMEK